MHLHVDVSAAEPAAHVRTATALASQAGQAWHEVPLPKNPALQRHAEVSAVEPAAHVLTAAALAPQGRHAWHVRPSP